MISPFTFNSLKTSCPVCTSSSGFRSCPRAPVGTTALPTRQSAVAAYKNNLRIGLNATIGSSPLRFAESTKPPTLVGRQPVDSEPAFLRQFPLSLFFRLPLHYPG